MIRVSAGIIRDASGRILVCRRGEGRANAHLWEFPGGKQEIGEDEAACLRRELMEELQLPVTQLHVFAVTNHQGIRFTFLEGKTDAQPVRTEHEAIRFIQAREMLGLDFCPADEGIARRLAITEPRIRAIFWDFDGTLFDTYPMMSRALQSALARFGIDEPADQLLRLMKQSLSDAVNRLSRTHRLDPQALQTAYRQEEQKTRPADYPLTPGICEVLALMHRRGCSHYLVTHRDHRALDALQAHGLMSLFSDWVTSELGFPRKPDPASNLYLLRKHHLDPAETCMVGDRPLDIEAGYRAGMLACLLDREGLFPDTSCALRTADATGLADLLCPPETK